MAVRVVTTITFETPEEFREVVNFLLEVQRDGTRKKARQTNNAEKTMKEAMKEEARRVAIELLRRGVSDDRVAEVTGLTIPQVRAYKAHLTMGTYNKDNKEK